MSEEAILHLIYHAIGIVLGMVIGWFLHSSREKGLDSNSELCGDLASSVGGSQERIADSEERITDSESRITELIDAGRDIEEIFRKYSEAASEDKESE